MIVQTISFFHFNKETIYCVILQSIEQLATSCWNSRLYWGRIIKPNSSPWSLWYRKALGFRSFFYFWKWIFKHILGFRADVL